MIYPVLFIAILGTIRITTSPKPVPAVNSFPTLSLDRAAFILALEGSSFLVSPNSSTVKSFVDVLFADLLATKNVSLTYFTNEQQAEQFYLNTNTDDDTVDYIGLHFEDGTLVNFNYTIRMEYSSVAPSSSKYGNQGMYINIKV